MKTPPINNAQQLAYVLADTLLAVVIAAVIIVAATHFFSQASFNSKVSKAMQQIQSLSDASYEWLQIKRQADFSGVSLAELQKNGLINCKTTPCTLTNPWGGSLSVTNPTQTNNSGHVAINLATIPLKACNNLSKRLQKTKHSLSPCGTTDPVAEFTVVI